MLRLYPSERSLMSNEAVEYLSVLQVIQPPQKSFSPILSSIIHPFHTGIRFPDISLQSLSRIPRALYPAVCFSDHSPLLSWRTYYIILLFAS